MTSEGEKPLDASCGHSPGMVALVPRRAHRALRYLHHAGIRLVLSKFGRMPRVRASGGLTAPEETQGGPFSISSFSAESPHTARWRGDPETRWRGDPDASMAYFSSARQIFHFTSYLPSLQTAQERCLARVPLYRLPPCWRFVPSECKGMVALVFLALQT